MNKKIIEHYMTEVWNHKNLEVINEVFSETPLIHSPLGLFKTRDAMTQTVSKWLTAIPDMQVDLLNTFDDGGVVISHWKAKGTHSKDLNGIKATGNPVEYQGVTMYRMDNGKVVEYWAYIDTWTLEKQMKNG